MKMIKSLFQINEASSFQTYRTLLDERFREKEVVVCGERL